MYKIDLELNQLIPLTKQSFKANDLTEVKHLQEWIAKNPEVLGEDLLIIQKEFDGFDDTRERLDLLALDKQGQLVIIENKLDDSGRDVVWQAQKYAAYCSTLTKADIIEIYQSYLQRYSEGESASERIQDFLEATDLDEVELNPAHHQRLIYVAANFRKEVTSTVLWLMEYGLQIQCFKVTPYQHGDDLFLSVEQTLPAPNTEEMVIKRAAKEADSQRVRRTQHLNESRYQQFWSQILQSLERLDLDFPFNPNQQTAKSDIYTRAHLPNGAYDGTFNIVLTRKHVRLQLALDDLYQPVLREHQSSIESQIKQPVEWVQRDGWFRIFVAYTCDPFDSEQWSKITDWITTYLPLFQSELALCIERAEKSLA